MESVIAALKDTPIPTIMVVAGIVFLLLSIAGQLAGRIAVPPERQRWAAVMGGILLVSGVALYVVPPARLIPSRPPEVPTPEPATKAKLPSPTPEAPPSTQPPPTPPEPTAQAQDETIPSLNAHVTALRFFEGSRRTVPSPNERVYSQRFAKAITRYIYTELTLAHPKPGQRIALTIQAVYQHENGRIIGTPELRTHLAADGEGSRFWLGDGRSSPNHWAVGSYKVNVYINGQKVGSGSFEIYE